MINSQEIKIGTCIRMDGKIWTCIDFQHRKPGKGNTVMITKLKNVLTAVCLSVHSRLVSSSRMFAWSVVLTSIFMRMPQAVSS